jgi:hypothetical protein
MLETPPPMVPDPVDFWVNFERRCRHGQVIVEQLIDLFRRTARGLERQGTETNGNDIPHREYTIREDIPTIVPYRVKFRICHSRMC